MAKAIQPARAVVVDQCLRDMPGRDDSLPCMLTEDDRISKYILHVDAQNASAFLVD